MEEANRLKTAYLRYYEASFPFEAIYRWFSYNDTVEAPLREWSYEALICSSSERFIRRFQIFQTPQQIRNLALEGDPLPLKFDIGPIYSADILQRHQTEIVAVEKEFVFDVDANDYKAVRTCCEGAKMCPRCWKFMECAMCILVVFCKTYGFENYIFAFSGRRGMHCWICDEAARKIDQQTRLNMLKMFELIVNEGSNLELLTFQHFEIDMLFEICEKFFCSMYEEQEWGTRGYLDEFFKKVNSEGKAKCPMLGNVSNPQELKNKVKPELWRQICLYFTYPRFDIQVTKSLVHLLKIPFSVHSETLWVAVPMNPEYVLEEYGIDFLKVRKYNNLNHRYQFDRPCRIGDDVSEYTAFLSEFLDTFL